MAAVPTAEGDGAHEHRASGQATFAIELPRVGDFRALRQMIETFISRPNWAPPEIEVKLADFYELLGDLGFTANTIGKDQAPLQSPFEDVRLRMNRCECTIVLGLPQVFIARGNIKDTPVDGPLTFATEWNQIEGTMSLMLGLPTLVLLQKGVCARGIFDRGAANVFVYEFDALASDWLKGIRPGLAALKRAVPSRDKQR